MQRSQDFLFFPLFLTLVFGLMIFGVHPLSYILMLGILILFWRYSFLLEKKTTLSKSILYSSVGIVAVQVLSIFTTVSIPLTLHQSLTYALGFLCLYFFLRIKKTVLPLESFKQGALILGVVTSLVIVVLNIFPGLAKFFDIYSLFSLNYGHIHASLYLVLVIPFAWEKVQREALNWKNFTILTLLIGGIIASFGRVSFMLLIMLLGVFSFRKLHKMSWKMRSLSLASLVILFIFISIPTLFPSILPQSWCSHLIVKQKICKPLEQEKRPEYWQQALIAISQKPLLGWGAGTFSIASQQVKQEAYLFSTYAHNGYLQFVVEYGVLGSLPFLVFTLSLCILIYRRLFSEKTKSTLDVYLSVSLLIFFLDGLFDFNWSYLSIWIIFTVFAGMMLRDMVHQNTEELKQVWLIKITAWFSIGLLLGYICLSGLSAFLWSVGSKITAQHIFPFDVGRTTQLIQSEQMLSEDKNTARKLYAHHFAVIQVLKNMEQDPVQKNELYQQMLSLEPLSYTSWEEYIRFLFINQKWQELAASLEKFSRYFPQNRFEYTIPIEQRKLLVERALLGGNQVFSENQELALRLYEVGYKLQPWQLSEFPVVVLTSPEKYDAEVIHRLVDSMDPKWLWKYNDKLGVWYRNETLVAIEDEHWNKAQLYTQLALKYDRPQRWNLWSEGSSKLSAKSDKYFFKGANKDLTHVIETWRVLYLETLERENEQPSDLEYKKLFKERLLLYSRTIEPSDHIRAREAKVFAEQVIP